MDENGQVYFDDEDRLPADDRERLARAERALVERTTGLEALLRDPEPALLAREEIARARLLERTRNPRAL